MSTALARQMDVGNSGQAADTVTAGHDEQPLVATEPDARKVGLAAVHWAESRRPSARTAGSSMESHAEARATSGAAQQGMLSSGAMAFTPGRGEESDLGRAPARPVERKITRSAFVSQQIWEGRVEAVGDGFFTARLFNQTEGSGEAEAEFDIAEVSPDDRGLVRPGALFTWHLGKDQVLYETPAGVREGQIRKSAVIVFRRLPKWTRRDLDSVKAEVDELAELLND